MQDDLKIREQLMRDQPELAQQIRQCEFDYENTPSLKHRLSLEKRHDVLLAKLYGKADMARHRNYTQPAAPPVDEKHTRDDHLTPDNPTDFYYHDEHGVPQRKWRD